MTKTKIFQKSELNFLKARVAQLEAQLGCNKTRVRSYEGNQEVHPGISDQYESKNFPTRQDDLSTSYKPFIKYTKLEFKVDTFFAVGSPLGVFLSIQNNRIGLGLKDKKKANQKIGEEITATLLTKERD